MNPGSKLQLSFCHCFSFESAWVPPGRSRFYGAWLSNCYGRVDFTCCASPKRRTHTK